MKAIIIAAGRSTRLKPIEDKNFLTFLGRSLIENQVEMIASAGLNDFVIVGGAHNLARFKEFAEKSSHNIEVIEQEDLQDGMAGAISSLSKHVKEGPVVIVSSNDMVDKSAFEMVVDALDAGHEGAIVAKEVTEYFPGGYLKTDKEGWIKNIVEKPGAGKEPSNLVNLVVHGFQDCKVLYEALKKASSERDDRYEVALDAIFKSGKQFKALGYGGMWQAVKYPWHVLDLMEKFLGEIEERFPDGRIGGERAQIAETATIRGKNVFLESGVKIMDNAVIQGPVYIGANTVVAGNSLVRNAHIGENCVIGFATEVARSYLGNRVWTHTNYIGDSIIGDNVSFGAGTVTGNLRLDEAEIGMNIKEEKIMSGRNKLGIVTGNDIRVGVNSSFMPGVKLGHNVCVGSGINVNEDIPDNIYAYGKSELTLRENKVNVGEINREELKKKL